MAAPGPEVLDVAVTYLRISAIGVPFVLVGLSAQGVLRGASDYRTPLAILVAIATFAALAAASSSLFSLGWTSLFSLGWACRALTRSLLAAALSHGLSW